MGNPASARFNIRDVDTCATEPDMVSRPSASPGDETLEVSWSEPDDGGAEIKRYHVQHRDSSSSWPSDYTSVSDRTLDITGLTNGVLYYVRVQACNDVGCGDWSRSASAFPGPRRDVQPRRRSIRATAGCSRRGLLRTTGARRLPTSICATAGRARRPGSRR